MKKQKIWIGLLSIITFGLIAGVAGNIVAREKIRGASITWESIVLPGGQQPNHFVLDKGLNAYISTVQGTLLTQNLNCSPSNLWQEANKQAIQEETSLLRCTLDGANINNSYKIQLPPGRVAQQLDCEYRISPDGGGCNYRFVILDNGELWRWLKVSSGFLDDIITYFVITGIFTTVGGLFGALLFGLLKSKIGQSSGLL
jgi:hypothetical protein